jgi:hypothetical protein
MDQPLKQKKTLLQKVFEFLKVDLEALDSNEKRILVDEMLPFFMPPFDVQEGKSKLGIVKERRILVEKTKNNERRMVPINDTLHWVLKSLPVHLGTDVVFPGITGHHLSVAFRRACKRAGIKDFRFHDLAGIALHPISRWTELI